MKLKIDTDLNLGQEGKRVFVKRKGKRHIGHLCTEEYGSKILSLEVSTSLTSKDGLFAAKVLSSSCRGNNQGGC